MKDRDCENCVHAKPFGGENDNRCSAWSCEYINRREAIEAYKTLKTMSEATCVITTGTPIIPISSTLASTKGE